MKTIRQLLAETEQHRAKVSSTGVQERPQISEKKSLNNIKKSAEIRENKFSVGMHVTNGVISGEIILVGPNYATVVENGVEHKVWQRELTEIELDTKRNQLYKESFIYKGYKSKHLTRELSEQFRDISKKESDQYAILSALKSIDFLMGVNEQHIIENFPLVRIQYERAKRYSSKFSINITEKLMAVESDCLNMAILENYKFSTTDRMMVAKMIASVADVAPYGNDPTSIINKAVISLRLATLTSPGWKMLGRMLKVATNSGISWNKDAFTKSQQEMMELQ